MEVACPPIALLPQALPPEVWALLDGLCRIFGPLGHAHTSLAQKKDGAGTAGYQTPLTAVHAQTGLENLRQVGVV